MYTFRRLRHKEKVTALVLLWFGCISFFVSSAFCAHSHPEKYFQKIRCREHNGQTEVRLADGTRADCITATHAIEFDSGPKWAEAIGQALFYGVQIGKRSGIVLILEK